MASSAWILELLMESTSESIAVNLLLFGCWQLMYGRYEFIKKKSLQKADFYGWEGSTISKK